ncbi:hypothetical protein DFJ73DRAFT_852971 [Zopfochytrium polystomum]|nr:hypothetical protein DFJ73DRAFT_852971 [Zopfochytrium polystomum]
MAMLAQNSPWIAHTQSDGKVYYFNSITGTSTWEKPDELKTPLERALAACDWKEYKTESGKRYFSNKVTKATVWEMPAEYKEIMDRFDKPTANPAHPLPLPPGPSVQHPLPPTPAPPVGTFSLPTNPMSSTPILPKETPLPEFVPSFETKEEATAAFKEVLIEAGVQSDWTWEQTMRAVIRKPMYRALKTLAERQQAFQDFIDEKRREEREAERAKFERERSEYRRLLLAIPGMNGWTKYRRVVQELGSDPFFMSLEEKFKMEMFEEFIDETRAREKEDQRIRRKESMDRLRHVLKSSPSINVETSWRDARAICLAHPDMQPPPRPDGKEDDPATMMPEPMDALTVFEDHMKALDAQYQEQRSRELAAQRREERKNRDAFRALLESLAAIPPEKEENAASADVWIPPIHAGAKWKDVYPLFAKNPAYLRLLGQPGSTPLELFWDLVAELDYRYQGERKAILDAVRQSIGLVVTIETPFEDFLDEFLSSFRGRPCPFSKVTLKQVFDEFMNKALAKQKEERRKQEKRLRKKTDAFKYVLKKLVPPITSSTQWTEVQPLVENLPEYEDLEAEQRIQTFEKFVQRLAAKANQKDKGEKGDESGSNSEEEGNSRRKRRHRDDRDSRERDERGRDRDRERRRHRRDSSRSRDASEEERGHKRRV